ncbi:glutathione S-transferase [Melanogaster broomeanus]|nr:glutathione S-transferase [Melanogaster broomeanus]
MVLKLHGFPISTCTRLVALICKEKEIPCELIVVDLTKGEKKSPAFMQHQPFGVIPYIVYDDGFILYESRAICSYLVKKYPTQAEALFEQAASVEGTNFAANAIPLAIEEVFKPRRGLQTNEARAAEYLATLNTTLDAYDDILGKQKYLAGEHLPFGALLCTAGHAEVFSSKPHVARWWNELTSRPAWNAVKDGTHVYMKRLVDCG